MNHLKKLKEIAGKEFMYNTRHTVINDYEIDEEGLHLKVTISGTTTELLVPSGDAHEFFNSLLPVGESHDDIPVEAQQQSKEQSIATLNNQFADQQQSLALMRKQLMSFNDKLTGEDSAKYINQAKALNNNVNTIINSLKLEFQVAKEIRRNQNK